MRAALAACTTTCPNLESTQSVEASRSGLAHSAALFVEPGADGVAPRVWETAAPVSLEIAAAAATAAGLCVAAQAVIVAPVVVLDVVELVVDVGHLHVRRVAPVRPTGPQARRPLHGRVAGHGRRGQRADERERDSHRERDGAQEHRHVQEVQAHKLRTADRGADDRGAALRLEGQVDAVLRQPEHGAAQQPGERGARVDARPQDAK
eukprot:CAMPEP_0179950470 /NCGR_PEP_ID=MMETSP0983-20121128/22957_1 /TAXON_ID=483367 /ORGANISM="non described non described, Strain CCMP 2436" /LENGTH=206 /DNA_ID=CAMNT_0021860421 /DNA_START=158 /DNA_END=777 /DNA_ORIENTATION=-